MKIIHRDIKPLNIFISKDNQIKIGDLGIARNLAKNRYKGHERVIVGTPLFLAPEVLKRKADNYMRDYWALGCVLYYILVKEPPFQSRKNDELKMKILHRKPIKQIPPFYTTQITQVVEKLLIKDPSKRLCLKDVIAQYSGIEKQCRIFGTTNTIKSVADLFSRISFSEQHAKRNISPTFQDPQVALHTSGSESPIITEGIIRTSVSRRELDTSEERMQLQKYESKQIRRPSSARPALKAQRSCPTSQQSDIPFLNHRKSKFIRRPQSARQSRSNLRYQEAQTRVRERSSFSSQKGDKNHRKAKLDTPVYTKLSRPQSARKHVSRECSRTDLSSWHPAGSSRISRSSISRNGTIRRHSAMVFGHPMSSMISSKSDGDALKNISRPKERPATPTRNMKSVKPPRADNKPPPRIQFTVKAIKVKQYISTKAARPLEYTSAHQATNRKAKKAPKLNGKNHRDRRKSWISDYVSNSATPRDRRKPDLPSKPAVKKPTVMAMRIENRKATRRGS